MVGTPTVDWLMELAIRMADRADELAMSGFFSYFDVYRKPDGTPVTSVDRRIESDLRKLVAITHPDAGVLGEELGEDAGTGRWTIDPIDGTVEFIEGDPRFATLIAYEHAGEVIVGVVSAPALGLRWWAGRGLGAFVRRDGVISGARVSTVVDPMRARALVPIGTLDAFEAETADVASARVLADAGVRLKAYGPSWQAVRVASGDYDAAIARGCAWDVAPLPVIVSEAGGLVLSPPGDSGQRLLEIRNRRLDVPAFASRIGAGV